MKFNVMTQLTLLIPFSSWASECQWPEWALFKQHYIEDGRVVDDSDERKITTSEGQSYAMFFALVANDKPTFDQLFHWTQNHLADGDLGSTLPAWLWGRDSKTGINGTLDTNSASDSDLWIAYNLAEAGRLWDNYAYRSTAMALAEQILKKETAFVETYQWVLLPGAMGFDIDKSSYRLNPSYSPIQLLRRFTELSPDPKWESLLTSSFQIQIDSAKKGFSPDWIEVSRGKLKNDRKTRALGSYNSIRSYLWAGMLHQDAPEKAALVQQFSPMAAMTQERGAPPRLVNTQSGTAKEQGSPGFSAAMLPLLHSLGLSQTVEQQLERVKNGRERLRGQHYYDSVLMLYGLGWIEQRYQFSASGELIISQQESCVS